VAVKANESSASTTLQRCLSRSMSVGARLVVLVLLAGFAIAMTPCSATAAPVSGETTVSSGGLSDEHQRDRPATRLAPCPGCPCIGGFTAPSAAAARPCVRSQVGWTRPPEDRLSPGPTYAAFHPPKPGRHQASATPQ